MHEQSTPAHSVKKTDSSEHGQSEAGKLNEAATNAVDSQAASQTMNRSDLADGKKNAETKKPDPTRYGDWEKNGRCIDF